jgi:hypothetical protein
MKLPEKIKEFQEGDQDIMSADRMNEIVAVANCFLGLRAGPGIKITRADSGIIIERIGGNARQPNG